MEDPMTWDSIVLHWLDEDGLEHDALAPVGHVNTNHGINERVETIDDGVCLCGHCASHGWFCIV